MSRKKLRDQLAPSLVGDQAIKNNKKKITYKLVPNIHIKKKWRRAL